MNFMSPSSHSFHRVSVFFTISAFIAATASADPITPAVPEVAHPLPLAAVRLTGGPLKDAQEADAKYLLSLEPDRMLYGLRTSAGLKPKAAHPYDGWDNPTNYSLAGHIAGHYLSAVSYMYAATGDTRFKDRADYIVSQLKEIQDAQGDGYLGALINRQGENGKKLFEELDSGTIRSGGFDLNGLWSPWYVEHKIFAGLRDAYHYTGNPLALEVEIKFAGWVDGIVSKLTEAQDQRMLATEFGGMNEVLADLYADTGDKRWLATSDKFEHHAIVDPLSQDKDILGGKHGNTQVPKLLGELKRYYYTGNETDGKAARFFWNQVVYHHSFATGGHGYDEYFDAPDKLSDEVDGKNHRSQDLRTCESCNVYNMLKMTRLMFAIQPDDKYAEFQERALFNHVLASIDDDDGQTCYMVPIGQGVLHEYQDMESDFTCCVGTGMENHALNGYGIYYEAGDKLWVNLYAPSTADWKSAGTKLTMDTGFPVGDDARLTVTLPSPKNLTLALRRPSWAGDGFSVAVNGKPVASIPAPGNYVEVTREWKSGDSVSLILPKKLHEDPLPDNSERVALMWGPLVLAADLGPESNVHDNGRRGGVQRPATPAMVTADSDVADWLKPVAGETCAFRSDNVGRELDTNQDVTFKPFYLLPKRAYAVYFDVFTPSQWQEKAAPYLAQKEEQQKLAAATIGYAQPGQMQPERDYNFQSSGNASVEQLDGHAGRRATDWFSFDLPVDPSHPMKLVVTYSNRENATRNFDILVDGTAVGHATVEGGTPVTFKDVDYSIPAGLVNGKQKVTVRFQASAGSEVAAVFGIRMVRGDSAM
jgi:uncharacterized protein